MAAITEMKSKSGDTTYRAQVMVNGTRESKSGFLTRTDAKDWAKKVEVEHLAGERGQVVPKTVIDGLQKYAKRPGIRDNKLMLAQLDAFERKLPFAKKLMKDVTTGDVSSWIEAGIESGLSTATVRRQFNTLRCFFRIACDEWSYLHVTPFKKGMRPADGKARTRRVSDEEQLAVMKALDYVEGMTPETTKQFVGAMIVLAVESAMRKGEILSLDNDAPHFDCAPGDEYVHLDKTKNGDERDVPMSPRALALIASLPKDGPWFPVHPNTFQKVFGKAVKSAGSNWHFHDLRREACTRLADLFPVQELALISGHHDIKTLIKHYYQPKKLGWGARMAAASVGGTPPRPHLRLAA